MQHLGETVRYAKGAHPGAPITYTDVHGDIVTGFVIDQAANGVKDGQEARGCWLWVMPHDGPTLMSDGRPVRVRFYPSGARKGQAVLDAGPMWQRSIRGPGFVVEVAA